MKKDYSVFRFNRTRFFMWLAVCEMHLRFPLCEGQDYKNQLQALAGTIQLNSGPEVLEQYQSMLNRIADVVSCVEENDPLPKHPEKPLQEIVEELGAEEIPEWLHVIRTTVVEDLTAHYDNLKSISITDNMLLAKYDKDLKDWEKSSEEVFEMFELELGLYIT